MSVNIKTENGLVKVAGKVNSFPVNKISSSDYLEDSPIGTVISFMGTTAPSHYLVCDGTVYNIADYSDLADFIQTQFGSKNYFGGNGTTTFAVPDLDNEFEDSISCIKYESTYFMEVEDVGYSTSETFTGKTWIDGKPIYRKVFTVTSPSVADQNVNVVTPSDFDFSKIDKITELRGLLDVSSGGVIFSYPLNMANYNGVMVSCWYRGKSNGIGMNIHGNPDLLNKPTTIILEYTKTTD